MGKATLGGLAEMKATYIEAVREHHHGEAGVGAEVARVWGLWVVHSMVEDVHSIVCMV
jgi:hypothetical protein